MVGSLVGVISIITLSSTVAVSIWLVTKTAVFELVWFTIESVNFTSVPVAGKYAYDVDHERCVLRYSSGQYTINK